MSRPRRSPVLMPALAALALLAAPAHAQAVLRPVDEAALRPDFFSFRAQLQSAVARRDAAAVLAVVHRNVKASFGRDDGVEGFRRMWRPTAAGSRLWEELGVVLALGGSFDRQGRFVAPYVFSRWPEKVDAFTHVAILGERVRVRAAPEGRSAILAHLSFALVPLAAVSEGPRPRSGWTAVRLPGGRKGYVATRYTRSPVDYRAIFERREGRWQLVVFVAGD